MGLIRTEGQAPRSRSFRLLQKGAESIFSALFPAECRICGELLVNISRLPVCAECLASTHTFDHPQCQICGELLLGQMTLGEGPFCGLCRRARPSYERAFAYGPYEGVLRDLIHLLKYQRILPAARPIGKLLVPSIAAAVRASGGDAAVVPVPLYTGKARERGFNQTVEIAREAVRASGEKVSIAAHLLSRVRETKSQTGLTRHQRRENLRGAFAVEKKFAGAVKGRNIILLDDVFTTGTTAEECARVMRRAGAAQVWVVTAARVSKIAASAPEADASLLGIPQKERTTAALGNAAAQH